MVLSGHLTGNINLLNNYSYMEHQPNTNDKDRETANWHCQKTTLFRSNKLTSLKSQHLKLEKWSGSEFYARFERLKMIHITFNVLHNPVIIKHFFSS